MPTVAKQSTSTAVDKAESSGKCPAASGRTAVSSIIHSSELQRGESAFDEVSQPGSDPRLLVNIFGRAKMRKRGITEVIHDVWKEHPEDGCEIRVRTTNGEEYVINVFTAGKEKGTMGIEFGRQEQFQEHEIAAENK